MIWTLLVGTSFKFLVKKYDAIINTAMIIQLVTTVSLIWNPFGNVIIHCAYFTTYTSFLLNFDTINVFINITT